MVVVDVALVVEVAVVTVMVMMVVMLVAVVVVNVHVYVTGERPFVAVVGRLTDRWWFESYFLFCSTEATHRNTSQVTDTSNTGILPGG